MMVTDQGQSIFTAVYGSTILKSAFLLGFQWVNRWLNIGYSGLFLALFINSTTVDVNSY